MIRNGKGRTAAAFARDTSALNPPIGAALRPRHLEDRLASQLDASAELQRLVRNLTTASAEGDSGDNGGNDDDALHGFNLQSGI